MAPKLRRGNSAYDALKMNVIDVQTGAGLPLTINGRYLQRRSSSKIRLFHSGISASLSGVAFFAFPSRSRQNLKTETPTLLWARRLATSFLGAGSCARHGALPPPCHLPWQTIPQRRGTSPVRLQHTPPLRVTALVEQRLATSQDNFDVRNRR